MGWQDAKARAERREEDQRRRRIERAVNRGGTFGSSSFKSKPNRDDPSVNNHYFNSPGDGSAHGHVQEQRHADGSVSYPYVRDVEGNEYDA